MVSWREIPCGVPSCRDLADILCVSLDGPQNGAGLTMALCVPHFWDWNAKSLEKRGHHDAARQIRELLQRGELTQLRANLVPNRTVLV